MASSSSRGLPASARVHDSIETDPIKALEKRVKTLEDKEIEVSDLPMKQIKAGFQKEPVDPLQTLLPHSVTKELLSTDLTDHAILGTSTSSVDVTLETPVPIVSLTFPSNGHYICGLQSDSECVNEGYHVQNLEVPAATPQSVLNVDIGYRVPNMLVWPCKAKAGEVARGLVWMAGGSGWYRVHIMYLWYIKIGVY